MNWSLLKPQNFTTTRVNKSSKGNVAIKSSGEYSADTPHTWHIHAPRADQHQWWKSEKDGYLSNAISSEVVWTIPAYQILMTCLVPALVVSTPRVDCEDFLNSSSSRSILHHGLFASSEHGPLRESFQYRLQQCVYIEMKAWAVTRPYLLRVVSTSNSARSYHSCKTLTMAGSNAPVNFKFSTKQYLFMWMLL